MINSDVLDSVTLSNGGYAQRSGNRTGAELGFLLREGSRERTVVRASVSGTSASLDGRGAARPRASAGRGWCRGARAISI